jgi:DNA-binding NtrC family response regulator
MMVSGAMDPETRAVAHNPGLAPGRADDVECAARSDVPVLIVGRTAAWRYRLAREIHEHSAHKHGSWTVVSCADGSAGERSPRAADPSDLRAAWLANGGAGTVFIDDLADMGTALQEQLLGLFDEAASPRTAPDGRVERPRLVTGASPGLLRVLKAGGFSERLFYRLNVIRLDVDGEAHSEL